MKLRQILLSSTALVCAVFGASSAGWAQVDLTVDASLGNSPLVLDPATPATYGQIVVGSGSTGVINQLGGTVTSTGRIYLGNTGSVGTYNLSGGVLDSLQTQVGPVGTGIFNQSAGIHRISESLALGIAAGSVGTYNLSGGTIESFKDTWLGYLSGSVGTFNQNGGIHIIGPAEAGPANGLNIGLNGTGTYNLNSGRLEIHHVDGNASSAFNLNGGTLRARADNSNWISTALRVNVRDGGARIDTAGHDVAINGNLLHSDIAGDELVDGGLTKLGAGMLTLTGTNTYTGATIIEAGQLNINNSSALGSGEIVMNGGALNATENVVLNQDTRFPNTAPHTVTISASSGKTLTLTGPGAPRFSGNVDLVFGSTTHNGTVVVDWSGGTIAGGSQTITVAGGTVRATDGTLPTLLTSVPLTVETSALLDLGNLGTPFTIRSLSGEGTISTGTSAGSAVQIRDGVFSGTITGAGRLVKTSTGSLVLSGTGTYGGTTSVLSGGTITTTGGAALPDATALTVDGGYNVNSSETVGSLAGSGSVSIASGQTLTAGGNNTSTAFSGILSGSGALTTSGTGTLTLTGANTYTGGTTVSAGTLQIGNGGTSGSIVGNITSNANVAFNRSDSITFGNIISGLGSLTKLGADSLTLTGANTYAGGTTISAGTLQIGNGATAGSITGNMLNNGTLVFNRSDNVVFAGDIDGLGQVVKRGAGRLELTNSSNSYSGGTVVDSGTLAGNTVSIRGNIQNDGSVIFTDLGPNTFAGNISGSGSLTVDGAGALTLTGTNTFTGDLTVGVGKGLAVASDSNLGAATSRLILDGGELVATANFTTGRAITLGSGGGIVSPGAGVDLTLSGVISGSTGLIKGGAGSLVLTGANTYTGGTNVQAGTLRVNGSVTGATNVQSGATLGGTGSLTGTVTVADGGTLAPGNSPGTLTVGSLVLSSGSNLNFELGTTSDLVNVTNNLTVAGRLNVSDSGGFGLGTYRLFNYGGSLTQNPVTLGSLPIGYNVANFSLDTATANQINLIVTAVASDQYWSGGSGTWNAPNTNWTNESGTLNANWGGQTGVFNLAGGTVTVEGTQTFQALRFETDGYSFVPGAGGALAIAGAQGDIRVEDGVTTTIAAPISGTGMLAKGGGGTLVLSGSNVYSGGTLIDAGVLAITTEANLGAPSGSLTIRNGASLRADADLVLGRNLALEAGGGRIDSSGHNVTLSGAISGAGGLTKAGAGSLALSGALSYAGDTVVDAGSLDFEGATDGLVGNLVNNASVAFSQTADSEFAGAVSGTGTLTKRYTSILTLSGALSYSGATIIQGGTLRLTGDTSGLTGPITNNGALLLDQAGRSTLSAAVSGSGSLTKAGAGTLTLSGTNSYTGGTFLDGGVLAVSSDTNLGDASAAVTFDGGSLRFSSAFTLAPTRTLTFGAGGGTLDTNGFDTAISQAIAGPGSLTKQGAGTLSLTGTSTLSGPTIVAAGRLAVSGSLASSAVTVESGAALSGMGTIGGLSALSGSIVAPGGSIGTLRVSGNVAFAAGSTYQAEINGAGQSDRIAATGAASLSGGTVQILPDLGTGYVADSPYTLLTAAGGVTGRFTRTQGGEFAFITPTLSYTDDAVLLTLVRKTEPTQPTPPNPPATATPVAFNSVAVTPNQYNTATAVEALGAGNRLYDVVLGSSVSGARAAFTALSGEVHASGVTAGYEQALQVQNSILARLRQPLRPGPVVPTFAHGPYAAAYAADLPGQAPQPVAVTVAPAAPAGALWGEGFGSWGRTRSDGNAASLETSTGGFILGADAEVSEAFRIGLAGGFARTSFDVDGRLSSGSNESVFGALYGSGSWGAINLRLGASYAWHDIDTDRSIILPGFSETASASYDGSTLQAFGEVGYRFDWGRAAFEPFVGASILRLHTDGFQEEGGASALMGYGRTRNLATTTLGIRGEVQVLAETPLMLKGLIGWRHAYGDVRPDALLAFAGGVPTFNIFGVPVDRNALVAEAGLDWQASEDLSLGVAYRGQIGSQAQAHALTGNLTWRFETR